MPRSVFLPFLQLPPSPALSALAPTSFRCRPAVGHTLWTSRLIGFYAQPDHSFTHILRIISRTEKTNNLLTIISNHTSHGSPSIYLISKEKAELKYVCPKMSHLQHIEIAFSVLHALVSSITRNHISAPLNQTSQPLNLILRSDTRARKRSS